MSIYGTNTVKCSHNVTNRLKNFYGTHNKDTGYDAQLKQNIKFNMNTQVNIRTVM